MRDCLWLQAADGPSWVNLDRDHYGAARIATVFVYLSSHEPDAGGATKFSHLLMPKVETAADVEANAVAAEAAAAADLVVALDAALLAAKVAKSDATETLLVAAREMAGADAERTARLSELCTAAAVVAPVVAPPVHVAPIAGSAAVWSNVSKHNHIPRCV